MKRKMLCCFVLCLSLILLTSNLHAELRDWGGEGEYFHDTDTGLYWWDPAEFVGWSYSEINAFITANPTWKWATSDEIDALVGKSSEGGVPLTEVMGPHQFQTGFFVDGTWYHGSRWIGYYENTPANPDGWLLQTFLDEGPPVVNDLSMLGDSGFQNNVDNWTHGAWINRAVDPTCPITISSSFTETPPDIDGFVGFGEWTISNRIELNHGFITVLNDRTRLYILVDVLEDTGDDENDYFWLTFDVDQDGEITEDVDLNYGLHPYTGNMRYQFYLGPGTWTGLQPETFSSKARGFGCFFGDGSLTLSLFPYNVSCNSHRVWEFGIDLAEIGAEPGGTTRMGLRVSSPNPSFTENIPPNFFTDFTDLIVVELAPPTGFSIAPSPFASVELDTNPIEVTQAIQTRDNILPLVEDKTTVARVYVDVDGVVFSQPSIVSLYASRDGVDLPGSPLAKYYNAPTSIDREDLNDTANFLLPNTWDDGTIQFRAIARDLFSNQSSSGTIPLTFTPKETPTYWIVPINTGTSSSPMLVSNDEISIQESYLETVYPVAGVDFVRKSWEVIGPTTVSNTIDELNDYHSTVVLAWILGLLFTGEAPFDLPDQIYGFTPSGGGSSDPVWIGKNGYVDRGYRGTSREATMAHEINHNLDRDPSGTWGRHTKFGCGAAGPDPNWPYTNDDIQEVGFDTRKPWSAGAGHHTVVPADYPDFMSYCQSGHLPTKWISPYRWENLFNNFSTVLTFGLRSEALAALRNKIQTVYYLSGQVHVDGTGELNPVLVQPGIPTEEILQGDYLIELLGPKGEILQRVPFFVSFVDVEGNDLETVHFNLQLPEVRDSVASIRLKLKNQVLDEIKVSEHPPSVQVLAPNGGEEWSGRETIKWSAHDEDQDPLSFTLLYTPDSGNTWFPVANNVYENYYNIDTSLLRGGKEAKIRVIATDGFNTSQDDSDETFTVLPNPPEVNIVQPGDGTLFELGQMISFIGNATDTEDEAIPEESFIWSYEGTVFGAGRQVEAALPEGNHVVMLTVTDSDGGSGTASVDIRVARVCKGDLDDDGDVDGVDLARLAKNPRLMDLAVFAVEFGRIDCPLLIEKGTAH